MRNWTTSSIFCHPAFYLPMPLSTEISAAQLCETLQFGDQSFGMQMEYLAHSCLSIIYSPWSRYASEPWRSSGLCPQSLYHRLLLPARWHRVDGGLGETVRSRVAAVDAWRQAVIQRQGT